MEAFGSFIPLKRNCETTSWPKTLSSDKYIYSIISKAGNRFTKQLVASGFDTPVL